MQLGWSIVMGWVKITRLGLSYFNRVCGSSQSRLCAIWVVHIFCLRLERGIHLGWHLLGTNIPADPLFSGLLKKPALMTGQLFSTLRQIMFVDVTFLVAFWLLTIRQMHWPIGTWQPPVTSCVRSKGWGQTVPHRLAHLSDQAKLCNTSSTGSERYSGKYKYVNNNANRNIVLKPIPAVHPIPSHTMSKTINFILT